MITMDDDRSSISSRYRNRRDTEISNNINPRISVSLFLSLSLWSCLACIESNRIKISNSIIWYSFEEIFVRYILFRIFSSSLHFIEMNRLVFWTIFLLKFLFFYPTLIYFLNFSFTWCSCFCRTRLTFNNVWKFFSSFNCSCTTRYSIFNREFSIFSDQVK